MDDLVASKGFTHGLPSNAIVLADGFIVLVPSHNGIDYLVVGSINEKYSVGLSKAIVKLIRSRKRPIVTSINGNYAEMEKVILLLGGEPLGNNQYVWQM